MQEYRIYEGLFIRNKPEVSLGKIAKKKDGYAWNS